MIKETRYRFDGLPPVIKDKVSKLYGKRFGGGTEKQLNAFFNTMKQGLTIEQWLYKLKWLNLTDEDLSFVFMCLLLDIPKE